MALSTDKVVHSHNISKTRSLPEQKFHISYSFQKILFHYHITPLDINFSLHIAALFIPLPMTKKRSSKCERCGNRHCSKRRSSISNAPYTTKHEDEKSPPHTVSNSMVTSDSPLNKPTQQNNTKDAASQPDTSCAQLSVGMDREQTMTRFIATFSPCFGNKTSIETPGPPTQLTAFS